MFVRYAMSALSYSLRSLAVDTLQSPGKNNTSKSAHDFTGADTSTLMPSSMSPSRAGAGLSSPAHSPIRTKKGQSTRSLSSTLSKSFVGW